MRLFTFYTVFTVWLLSIAYAQAQETDPATQIQVLEATKERIIEEEKEALKSEVENINERLEAGQLDQAEADNLKQAAAEKHALNIENRLAIVDNKIELLQRNDDVSILDDDDRVVLRISSDKDDDAFIYIGKKNRKRKYDRRTTSDFVLAVGFNNAITEGQSLNDSDFKVAGSRFAEIGWAWKTRVFKESNWLRLKYGFSFQFNGLKPTDNRFYVDNGLTTDLETFDGDLDKSKFRVDNLVFPVHFEFGPSKKIEKKDYFRYSTHNKIKIGVGGYAGMRLGTRQKLKYNDMGQDVKEKQKGNFNVNNFIYGVSAYLGWRDTALYVKYDLNTIFKDNPVEQRMVSLGLRFDMD